MRMNKRVGSFLFVVLGSMGAFAAPQVESAAKPRTASSPTSQSATSKPKVSARPALTQVNLSAAEVERAKSHKFGLVAGAISASDEDKDRPGLVRLPKPLDFKDRTPQLNIAKFGDTVHAALKDKVRGYALGLRQNGEHKLTLIWGWARTPEQGGQGWTLDTRMHVASVSKLMTAIVVTKMLHDTGRSVDTTIGEFLPDYWEQPESSANITFRRLLTHNAHFTIYDGDFLSFKRQIEMGVGPTRPQDAYTNASFSLLRVLVATATGAINPDRQFVAPLHTDPAAYNDAMWDIKTQEAFLNYAQTKVLTPSGVVGVSPIPANGGAFAYSSNTDKQGWDSGNLYGQLGGAGFRLSVNDVLNVMGTFRRKGTIVPSSEAREAIEGLLGLDRGTNTPAGKVYSKNGLWRNGYAPKGDAERSVALFMPNDIEVVVLANSWLGPEDASLRATITDAYIANLL